MAGRPGNEIKLDAGDSIPSEVRRFGLETGGRTSAEQYRPRAVARIF